MKLNITEDILYNQNDFQSMLSQAQYPENKDWITYSLALYTCAKAKEI